MYTWPSLAFVPCPPPPRQNEGNFVWVFPFSKLGTAVVVRTVNQRTTAIHTQPPKGASEVH